MVEIVPFPRRSRGSSDESMTVELLAEPPGAWICQQCDEPSLSVKGPLTGPHLCPKCRMGREGEGVFGG